MHATLAFSILYRIELTVTTRYGPNADQWDVFQYPLSDRTHCNSTPAVVAYIDSNLSVSSIGSNSL